MMALGEPVSPMPPRFFVFRHRVPCRFVSLVVLIGCGLASIPGRAEPWPQWRGPRGDGISTETDLPATWSKTKNVAWRTPLPGRAGATPCVWGDRIYLTSNDESGSGGDDLVLLAIDTADGRIAWKRRVTGGNRDARSGEGNSASPSPCTDGEHVWTFFSTGVLACHDRDGNEVWTFDVGERFGRLDIQFGMTSTPILDGGALYLQLIHGAMVLGDQTRTGKVIKLDARTGATIWAVDRITDAQFECKHSYASPCLYRHEGREFLVVHGADCTTGHALADGRELWRFGGLNGPTTVNPKPHDNTFRFVASPVTVPGTVIVPTCKGGPTVALAVSDDLAGDCTGKQGVVRWINPLSPDVSIPLVADGLVYMLHKDGKLQCVELATGADVYLERTHTGQHRSSPVLAGGRLHYGSNDGWLTLVQPGREFALVDSIDFGEAITASLAVSGGTLFVRSYEALYAIRRE
jgi:outer membrane protein assembly factor BamB